MKKKIKIELEQAQLSAQAMIEMYKAGFLDGWRRRMPSMYHRKAKCWENIKDRCEKAFKKRFDKKVKKQLKK